MKWSLAFVTWKLAHSSSSSHFILISSNNWAAFRIVYPFLSLMLEPSGSQPDQANCADANTSNWHVQVLFHLVIFSMNYPRHDPPNSKIFQGQIARDPACRRSTFSHSAAADTRYMPRWTWRLGGSNRFISAPYTNVYKREPTWNSQHLRISNPKLYLGSVPWYNIIMYALVKFIHIHPLQF